MPHVKLPRNKLLKIVVIFFLIILGLYFLPFVIGGYLTYFVYKGIKHNVIRYSLITGILLPTLFVGTAWAAGLTQGITNPPPPKPKALVQNISPTAKVVTTKAPEATPTPTVTKTLYSVSRVIDGDTIDVTIDGTKQRIRLIGINSPELGDSRTPVQCFAREAEQKADQVLSGKKVSIEADITQGDKDKYNRLLRYVFLEDGTDFNKMMIAEGYAHEYTYNTPYNYQKEYKQAETEARNGNKGLWNPQACVTPTPSLRPTVKMSPTSVPYVPPVHNNNTQPSNLESSGSNSNTNTTTQGSGAYGCDCSKTCKQISSCDEAQYQLKTCGCSARDADGDGIACDGAPLHCQN